MGNIVSAGAFTRVTAFAAARLWSARHVCGYARSLSRFAQSLGLAGVLVALLLLGLGSDGEATQTQITAVASATCGPVQYEGSAPAGALIVSDLPLRGASSERSRQMNDAIRLVLRAAGWRAGTRRVAFQACDDSDAATGL